MIARRYGPKKRRTVVVDGETFDVVEGASGSIYKWVSGPNPDYGFTTRCIKHTLTVSDRGTVPPPHEMTEDHERKIRDFLQMIDPETGFITDD
ncbi:hypothetical protein QSJ19_02330 [Gordonia sp. ABSL11-1]|uniref:hypothetical protein n=1 Tax=Gordonia sp. ABSL11-1 TaxID=3053924 RepID=UPI00257326CE|nr:hypothetical protein [Gordonia sp. ABSL11-1]MDL9944440.1 hypothetical protein [Gordonia sp. ABSL11-1]